MNKLTSRKLLWLNVLFVLFAVSTGFAQTDKKPYLPKIVVKTDNLPQPTPTPYVKRTAKSAPSASPMDTVNAGLSSIEIPGYSGVLVESLDGKVLMEQDSDQSFNPASNVKVATTYAVLKTFGPDYRFPTSVWTDGQIDRHSGILIGNLYITGRDPIFNYEHAVAIANELNNLGVRRVTGDLIVNDTFIMNFNMSSVRAGATLLTTMDAAKRSSAANTAWQTYLLNSRKFAEVKGVPSLAFNGNVYVQSVPTNTRLLFTHESAPMREILKATMCYSNNFLAERLGDMVGGAYAVSRLVQINAQVDPREFILQTSSGLGVNRVTPHAMMQLLRALRKDLEKFKMTFADIMPVAGVDKGTLARRFDTDYQRGSFVGKTGTLTNTDGGVSALSGEINTSKGRILFVIFNQRGSVARFRNFQNSFVPLIQAYNGGAKEMKYEAATLETRLARSRITYPTRLVN